MDKSEQIIRELTATRVKLENLCDKVEKLINKIEKHDEIILKNGGRLTELEKWKSDHEIYHEKIEKKIENTLSEINNIIEKIKEIETIIRENRRLWWAKVTVGSAIIGGICGAFATAFLSLVMH